MATRTYNPDIGSPRGYLRGVKLANLAQRWGAGAIDYIPAIVVARIPYIGWLFALCIILANNVVWQGLTGQSLGKRCLHLSVFMSKIDEHGDPWMALPGVSRCLIRQCLFFLDILFLYLGLIRPGWNYYRRCWSDSWTATFVAAADPKYLDLQIIDGTTERLLWAFSLW